MAADLDDIELRRAILYAVGSICDDEVQKQQGERHSRARPVPSKETLALLGDLVHKQAEVMATELQHFAHHANRKGIKPEDVLLCARKHPSTTRLLQKYQREHLGAANAGTTANAAPSRRRIRRPRLDSDEI